MDDDEKRRLYSKSEAANMSLADAFRIGAERYLDVILSKATASASASTGEGDDVEDVLADFHAAAARVERRLRGS